MKQSTSPLDDIARAIAEGDISEAKRLLEGLDASALERPRAALLSARLALAQGDPLEAKARLEVASARGADAMTVLRFSAQVHHDLNDLPAERKAREQLVAVAPTLPHLKALAGVCRRAGDADGAISAAQEGLRQDSACEWAFLILQRIAVERGGAGLFDILDKAVADSSVPPDFPNLAAALQLLPKEERRTLSDRISHKWPDDLKLRLEFASAAGEVDDILAILLHLYGSEPDRIVHIGQLVRLQLFRGDLSDATKLARKAVELYPSYPETHQVLYLALLQTAGRKDVAEAIRNAIATSSAYPKFKQIKLTLFGLETEEALELKARMIARWPESAQDLEIGRSKYAQAVDLALTGQRDEALLYLARQADAETETEISEVVELIKSLPDPADLKRPIVVDTGEEVVMSAPSTNGVTVLFFTGLADRVGLDCEAMDSFCAASGAATIFLRDETKMIFLMGIRSLAKGRAATVEALRDRLEAIGTRELIVFGSSGGSYSSVTYGLELGAARIIGLGAQTSIHHFLKPGGDPRVKLLIERIKEHFDPDLLDLKKVWQTFSEPPRLDLYFGAENRDDAAHANHMAGLDNVFLQPFPGLRRHDVLNSMVKSGMLAKFFEPGTISPSPTGWSMSSRA